MIVVCGITSDPSTALVIAALDQLGHTHAVLHQRRFEEAPIDAQIVGAHIEGRVLTDLGPIDCASVTGIYSRFMDWTVLPEVCDGPEETVERCRTWHHALSNWIEIAPGCVMNRAGASASNQSKPYQTQLIRQAGFQVPETLVTNDPELVHDFRARHGLLVYKSISSVRSIVQVLNDDADARLLSSVAAPSSSSASFPGPTCECTWPLEPCSPPGSSPTGSTTVTPIELNSSPGSRPTNWRSSAQSSRTTLACPSPAST